MFWICSSSFFYYGEKKVKILDELVAEMQSSQLPTNCDIIKGIFFLKETKSVTFDKAIHILAKQISEMWRRAAIPTVSGRSIERSVLIYFKKYNELCRSHSGRDSIAKFQTFKVKKFNCKLV